MISFCKDRMREEVNVHVEPQRFHYSLCKLVVCFHLINEDSGLYLYISLKIALNAVLDT